MKILITDIFLRKTFDVINILRSNHSQFGLILANYKRVKLKSKLLYNQKSFLLRKDTYDNFEKDLLEIERANAFTEFIYLPIEEDTTMLFYEYINHNKKTKIKYLLPNIDSFNLAKNKESLQQFCSSQGFSVPQQYTQSSLEDLNQGFQKLIVKPKEGSGSKGIKYIDSKKELNILKHLDYSKYFVQRQINNSKDVYGAFYLFNDGKALISYGHKRIRTFPLRGGVTVYSELNNNKAVLSIGEEILKKLKWNGFAMIEFLYDDIDENYKVIEINPRLWGSIMLSEFIGANFLENYINVCLNSPLSTNITLVKKYIRWFFPFDIINFFHSKEKIDRFWDLDRDNCCYINVTYSSYISSLLFVLITVLNIETVKKSLRKLFSK